MPLFATFTIWDSLLFYVMRDAAAAAAVNSWPPWLWLPELPSPLLSNPPWALPNLFVFFIFFLSKFELAFTETGLDQTHIFQNPNLNLSKVQVQVHISKNWLGKDLSIMTACAPGLVGSRCRARCAHFPEIDFVEYINLWTFRFFVSSEEFTRTRHTTDGWPYVAQQGDNIRDKTIGISISLMV